MMIPLPLSCLVRRASVSAARFLLVAVAATALTARSEPSGGPYGPIQQSYEIPKAAHVYFVSPTGDAAAPGTKLEQPTTLESAIEHVETGDVIVLRGGIYRTGGLRVSQGVTLQPY